LKNTMAMLREEEVEKLALRGDKILRGRKCYGHLGGKLGERLLDRLVELEWLRLEEGKSTVYEITEKGYAEFNRLGVKLD
jgi:hypothetical protein